MTRAHQLLCSATLLLLLVTTQANDNIASPVLADEKIEDTLFHTQIEQRWYVTSAIDSADLRVLLVKLNVQALERTGFKHRKTPNATRIFVYATKEHADDPVTYKEEWIGRVVKRSTQPIGKYEVQYDRLNRYNRGFEM